MRSAKEPAPDLRERLSVRCPVCGAEPGRPCRKLDSDDPERRSLMPRPHATRKPAREG